MLLVWSAQDCPGNSLMDTSVHSFADDLLSVYCILGWPGFGEAGPCPWKMPYWGRKVEGEEEAGRHKWEGKANVKETGTLALLRVAMGVGLPASIPAAVRIGWFCFITNTP